MSDSTELHGVVHGNMIELGQDAGFPDGQPVVVSVRAVEASSVPGEGLRQSFGGWAEDAEELDAYLEWNRQQRKRAPA